MCYFCGRRKPRAQLKHITANGQTNAILPQVNCIRTTERDVVNQNDATRELCHVSNFPNVEPPGNVGDFALALGESVCVTRMKLAELSIARFSANSRFASQVWHFFHSSIRASQPFFANRLTLSVTARAAFLPNGSPVGRSIPHKSQSTAHVCLQFTPPLTKCLFVLLKLHHPFAPTCQLSQNLNKCVCP